MNKHFIKNYSDNKTKTLDYDDLMFYLQNVEYEKIENLMQHSYYEILYFALLGYDNYISRGGLYE